MIEELSFERIRDVVNSLAEELREFDEDGKAMGCAMYEIRNSLTEDEKDLHINTSRVNAAVQNVRNNKYEYMAGGKNAADRLEKARPPSKTYDSVSEAVEAAGLEISREEINKDGCEEGCEQHVPDRSTIDILEDRLYDLKDTYESLGLLMHKMKMSIIDINTALNRMCSDDANKAMVELKDVVSKIDLRT